MLLTLLNWCLVGCGPSVDSPPQICADLNCDGWPDLVLARTQDETGSYDVPSLVYYGSADGFGQPVELPTVGAMGVAIADLDQDDFFEVVINQATVDGQQRRVDSLVFAGTAQGPDPDDPVALPTIGAADVDAVDVDEDGWTDLVFSNRYSGGDSGTDFDTAAYTNGSRIYWGSSAGFATPQEDATAATDLETIGAARAAVADLDGDGRRDLAFAHGTLFDSNSRVYRSTGDRTFEAWTTLPTTFAEGVTAGDADQDGWVDLLYANWCGGTSCDSTLYLGGADGFDADRTVSLPGKGAVDSAIVDLNGDGRMDLVLANSFDDGFDPQVDRPIYWGTDAGWSLMDRTRLATPGAGAVAVGDLNRDGYLDLAFAGYYGADSAAASPIYWGSASGFDEAQVTWLPAGAAGLALTPNALP